jgi:hypothetical protein
MNGELDPELDLWRDATEVPLAAVSRLEAQVLARTTNQPRSWPWIAAAALVGSLALALVSTQTAVTPSTPAASHPKPIELPKPHMAPLTPPVRPDAEVPRLLPTKRRESRREDHPQTSAAVSYIHIATDDPNITILLVTEPEGAGL